MGIFEILEPYLEPAGYLRAVSLLRMIETSFLRKENITKQYNWCSRFEVNLYEGHKIVQRAINVKEKIESYKPCSDLMTFTEDQLTAVTAWEKELNELTTKYWHFRL